MNYVDRPQFSEGQVLSATDLQLTVDYPRDQLETHCSLAHTSGVVDGLLLQIGSSSAIVSAGLAIDGLGRQLLLEAALPLAPDPLAGQPAGNYPAYIWYTEATLTTSLAPLNPCGSDNSDQIRETPMVGIFLSASAAAAQAPDAVCLGYAGWNGTALQAATVPNSVRQGGGVRAHTIVAPEHVVTVNAEDQGSTVFSVAGTVMAIASADGTAPTLSVPGGELAFSAAAGAPPSSTVSLSFDEPTATGNGLVINLGNNDPTSNVVVESGAGTALVTLDGSGTITASQSSLQTLNVSQTVTVTAGTSTLTLGPTPPSNKAGVIASDSLLLAAGTNSGDQIQFLAGSTPTGMVDATGLTMNNVKVGTLDSFGALGIAITNTAQLEIRTASNDLLINPGTHPSAPFRFTAGSRLLNQTVSPAVDVTPMAASNTNGTLLQLGNITVAFGTADVSIYPLSELPAGITFPVTFASPPAFFVAAGGSSVTTIAALATAITTTGASYRITQLAPIPPSDGDTATWSDDGLSTTVSWVALGTI